MKEMWIISPEPRALYNSPVAMAPGCANVEDDAWHPGEILSQLLVWHPKKKKMAVFDEEDAQMNGRENCADDLEIRCIHGFEVLDGPESIPGMFLRQGTEIYDRPVYESEL